MSTKTGEVKRRDQRGMPGVRGGYKKNVERVSPLCRVLSDVLATTFIDLPLGGPIQEAYNGEHGKPGLCGYEHFHTHTDTDTRTQNATNTDYHVMVVSNTASL